MSELNNNLICVLFLTQLLGGTKLKDFVATLQSDSNIQAEIAKLRHDVEEYAKQFPTIGFEKETMKYKN
jgi:glycine hydroxymethyltransferase